MVGFGYDSHRLSAGESLILGAVQINSELGTVAHSDGDALLHALTDALLGAAGLGDIGELFPDTDKQYKDAPSAMFVAEALRQCKAKGLAIDNIDCVIVLEKPKLKDYKLSIKDNIASICEIDSALVNVKAKTSEKLGFVGRSEGIEVYCVCQLSLIK